MYERSAIVLERYFDKLLKLNLEDNLKINYENYGNLLQEMKNYQSIVKSEEEAIQNFDEIAKEIQNIQREQEKRFTSNQNLEEERNRLFNDLDEDAEKLDKKFQNIEESIKVNNEALQELRESYIESLKIFEEKQKERNKYARARRTAEASHMTFIENANEVFEKIDINDVRKVKEFINVDKENVEKEITDIMMKNGRNEKVKFNTEVIKKSVAERIKMAEIEAECYVSIYDKMKKFLAEIDNENLKLARYQKFLRDASVKLAFIEAEKEYIVGFLDNERLTSMNGPKIHKKMMSDACENFDLDMIQIHNLFDLIKREIVGKSTKKAYKELYNKTYLKDIEEKEKSFEEEVNQIKINMGTVINSNYWRIEGIKNIYSVFQKEVSEKFEKDLSEYKLEGLEEVEEEQMEEIFTETNFDDEDDEEDEDEGYILNYNYQEDEDDADDFSSLDDEDEEDNEDEEYDEYDEDDEDDYDEDEEYDIDDEDDCDEDEGEDEDEDKKEHYVEKKEAKSANTELKNRNTSESKDDEIDEIISRTRQVQNENKKGLFKKLFKK